MLHQDQRTIKVGDGELQLLQLLGKGKFGEVYSATYTGNDPRILAMGNPVAVKTGKIRVDIAMAKYIDATFAKKPEQFTTFANQVCSGYSPTASSEPVLISAYAEHGDLQSFIAKAVANQLPEFVVDGQQTANTMAGLAGSMRSNIKALHDAGVYHFDIAARNFLVLSAKTSKGSNSPYITQLGDLGLARDIPPWGVFSEAERMKQLPVTHTSINTFLTGEFSILNDLYAFRATLLENLGLAAGMTPLEITETIFGFTHGSAMGYAQWKVDYYRNDSEYLTAIVERIRKAPDEYSPDPLKKLRDNKQLMIFLNAFGDYICNMPDYREQELKSKQGIKYICDADVALFQQAAQKFTRDMQQAFPATNSTSFLRRNLVSGTTNEEPIATQSSSSSTSTAKSTINSKPAPVSASTTTLSLERNNIAVVKEIITSEEFWKKKSLYIGLPDGFNDIKKVLRKINDIEKLSDTDAKKYWTNIQEIAQKQLDKPKSLKPEVLGFFQSIVSNGTKDLQRIKTILR